MIPFGMPHPTATMPVPVLLLVYKRPQHVNQVMQVLRTVRCATLFVAADGPRREVAGEAGLCHAARIAATDMDWPCTVQTRFLDENVGCARAVSSAISWFFEHNDRGIILEEDCVPDQSFFRFCEELLERYAHDDRIGVVTGNNFQQGQTRGEASYYFSRYPHCWGWATWRRAWNRFDFDSCKAYEDCGSSSRLLPRLTLAESAYWAAMRRMTATGYVDSWATRWMHSLWRHDMLTATPQQNLVVNTGFGEDATHTKKWLPHIQMEGSVNFPLEHPPAVACDIAADLFVAQSLFRTQSWPLHWLTYLKKRLMNPPVIRNQGTFWEAQQSIASIRRRSHGNPETFTTRE